MAVAHTIARKPARIIFELFVVKVCGSECNSVYYESHTDPTIISASGTVCVRGGGG